MWSRIIYAHRRLHISSGDFVLPEIPTFFILLFSPAQQAALRSQRLYMFKKLINIILCLIINCMCLVSICNVIYYIYFITKLTRSSSPGINDRTSEALTLLATS